MKKFLTNFILFCILPLGLSAQTAAEYTFAASSGTFAPLVGGTSAEGLGLTEDTDLSDALPIDFTFKFTGIDYTEVKVNSNGLLCFGTGSSATTNNLAASSTTYRPGLAPLWDDLQCTEGANYQTSGSAPNRVFTAEWLNMEWNYLSGDGVMSFQVKLYETTNVVEFVYRQEADDVISASASIGIMGTAATDFISLEDPSAAPTTSTTSSTNNISTKPATGQVYTFTPPVVTTAPDCTTLSSPEDTDTDVLETSSLSWTASTGVPSGYKLQIGTTMGGDEFLAAGTDVGAVTTYTPTMSFAYSTTYYVTITPYNDIGDAMGCTEESFTTKADPTITTFPWNEGFEASSTSASNFLSINNNGDGDAWVFTTSNPHTGSRAARLYTDFNSTNDDYLVTPPVALTGQQELVFWTRAQSSAEPDELAVMLSTTGTEVADFTTTLMASTVIDFATYAEYTIDLSAYSGTVYIAFVRKEEPANGWYVYVDDISIITIGAPPGCTNITAPADGDTDVLETTDITWASVVGATGYRITAGTSAGGTDIANNVDVMAATSYQPAAAIAYETTVYVTITPYSTNGDAMSCTEESFAIRADPTITTFPWNEGFEASSTSAGNFLSINNNGDGDAWVFTTSNPHTGSRAARLYTDFNSTNDDYLVTPPVALTGDQTLKFWTRAQSSAEPDELAVMLSTTGTEVADFTTTLMASTVIDFATYAEYTIDLSAYSGTVYIAFVRKEEPANGWYVYVDDISIFSNSVAPGCASAIGPTDAATAVSIDGCTGMVTLEWSSTGNTDSYDVYTGTTSGALTLAGNTTMTSYDIAADLNTTYYWQIVPKNTFGDAMSCLEYSFTTSETSVNVGSNEAVGYYFVNSETTGLAGTPTYSWVDPIASGHTEITTLTGGSIDDGYFTAPIGFTFNFFGTDYTEIHMGTNGYASFGSGYTTSGGGVTIPSTSDPDNMIAAAMMDQDSESADAKLYYGANGADEFVLTWYKWNDYQDSDDYMTYQIVLKSNNDILINYNDVESILDGDFGSDAVIGIENADGSDGLVYRSNGDGGPIFCSPMAVLFTTDPNAINPPLAVELTDFSAYAADKTNVIEWTTANEVDAASFVIERSFNGRAAWQQVGSTVAATNRSNSTSNYSLVDTKPTAIAYYRLVSTDVNGQSEISEIVLVERKDEVSVQVYPVPAQDQVSVDFNGNDGESVNIYITDVAGRLVKQLQLDTTDGLNQVQVNISDLADGIYFLTLDNGTAKATNRIVKQ